MRVLKFSQHADILSGVQKTPVRALLYFFFSFLSEQKENVAAWAF